MCRLYPIKWPPDERGSVADVWLFGGCLLIAALAELWLRLGGHG